MRLAVYGTVSTLLATGVVTYAFHERANFYSASVMLAQSNACLMILCNFGFFLTILFGTIVQKIFYGPLRPTEIEHLYERAWFAVTETCLAMTIFRDEFDGSFIVMFTVLLFLKCFHWLGSDRVDFMEQTPPTNPTLFHFRQSSSLFFLLVTDILLTKYCVSTLLGLDRPNMTVMFAFEFAILTISCSCVSGRYILGLVERFIVSKRIRSARGRIQASIQRRIAAGELEPDDEAEILEEELNEGDLGAWDEKGTYVFYLELITDLVKLLTYMLFFFIVLSVYGLPFHIIRDIYLTIRSFITRIRDFIRFRRATAHMDARYPDATTDEVGREGVCIICREEMVAWTEPTGEAAEMGEEERARRQRSRPKKLPCGHVLHYSCLRSWLERQQRCPTCRRPVLDDANPSPAMAAAGGAAAAAAAAAARGAGQQGQQQPPPPQPGAQPQLPQQTAAPQPNQQQQQPQQQQPQQGAAAPGQAQAGPFGAQFGAQFGVGMGGANFGVGFGFGAPPAPPGQVAPQQQGQPQAQQLPQQPQQQPQLPQQQAPAAGANAQPAAAAGARQGPFGIFQDGFIQGIANQLAQRQQDIVQGQRAQQSMMQGGNPALNAHVLTQLHWLDVMARNQHAMITQMSGELRAMREEVGRGRDAADSATSATAAADASSTATGGESSASATQAAPANPSPMTTPAPAATQASTSNVAGIAGLQLPPGWSVVPLSPLGQTPGATTTSGVNLSLPNGARAASGAEVPLSASGIRRRGERRDYRNLLRDWHSARSPVLERSNPMAEASNRFNNDAAPSSSSANQPSNTRGSPRDLNVAAANSHHRNEEGSPRPISPSAAVAQMMNRRSASRGRRSQPRTPSSSGPPSRRQSASPGNKNTPLMDPDIEALLNFQNAHIRPSSRNGDNYSAISDEPADDTLGRSMDVERRRSSAGEIPLSETDTVWPDFADFNGGDNNKDANGNGKSRSPTSPTFGTDVLGPTARKASGSSRGAGMFNVIPSKEREANHSPTSNLTPPPPTSKLAQASETLDGNGAAGKGNKGKQKASFEE